MKFWIGVTDKKWYRFLSEIRPDEVNFWQPSGTPPFTNAPIGLPFLNEYKPGQPVARLSQKWAHQEAFSGHVFIAPSTRRRGDHVTIKQLVDDFACYPYLPRLKDSSVLLGAIRED